ncbi:IST1-like protein [Cucurbita maxima]|uniref:IST1-like protein n=1 Tax=Cucurbita maxima TaxID=3661 RepID=A0A6J1KQI2_CUCMA|nr:IST1-like protein [Cucurbita maxima]
MVGVAVGPFSDLQLVKGLPFYAPHCPSPFSYKTVSLSSSSSLPLLFSPAMTAAARSVEIVKQFISLLRRGFNTSKCKTAAKMAVARIKLLRNKREAVVKQMRRDIALLLQSGQDATARIRVEHVIREQNVLAANEIIELFCELIVSRLSIIAKQRECPADLKEGVASLIFATPRCSEIPELSALRNVFEKKYGKDFVSAATDLRPNCGVNRLLIDKLSVRTPTGQVKLTIMKEIAKEHQIEWDTTESEKELLKPPEELIDGPRTFVSAASVPVKPVAASQSAPIERMKGGNINHLTNSREDESMHFQDTASAAEAAAKAAKQAIAAAQAAAYLANKDSNRDVRDSGLDLGFGGPQSLGRCRSLKTEEARNNTDHEMAYRRYSYNPTDIKFDESDCEEETRVDNEDGGGVHRPPDRNPPPVPSSRVHPKLPDYDTLAARFEALKHSRT